MCRSIVYMDYHLPRTVINGLAGDKPRIKRLEFGVFWLSRRQTSNTSGEYEDSKDVTEIKRPEQSLETMNILKYVEG